MDLRCACARLVRVALAAMVATGVAHPGGSSALSDGSEGPKLVDRVDAGGGARLAFFPAAPAPGEHRWSIGGVWQVAPQFQAGYRRGIGAGFAVDARAQTLVVYNQLGVGASWAAPVGPFQLGVMGHVDGYFGKLGGVLSDSDVSGFDSTGWGLLVEPGAMAGLQVARDAWLTILVELYLQPYQAQRLGDLVVTPSAPMNSGGRASLIVEHLAGAGVVYYGATLYHTTQNFPLWFNVNYSSAKTLYLGFLAGYEF